MSSKIKIMKNLLLILFFGLFFLKSHSQVNYEKAYFIDNKNVRTECFIKNKDLYNNPNSFEYKLSPEDNFVKIGEISNIKEFGIIDFIKFERNIVKMDMSSINLDKLSEKNEPEWKEQTLFLRVLIDGKATLYEYKNENLRRYFYKLNNSAVQQLIYKRYFVENTSHTETAANNDFQKQLYSEIYCENMPINSILKLEYRSDDLSSYFVEYNICQNYNYINYKNKEAKGSVNFKMKEGLVFSKLQIPFGTNFSYIDFGAKISNNIAGEVEYISPFNRNKWSIYLGTGYQTYKKKTDYKIINDSGVLFANDIIHKFETDYKYFDLIFGIRHYMFLNDKSSIYLNIGYVFGLPMNSTIKIDDILYREIYTRMGVTYGLGYNYKSKYNLEFRISSNHLDKYYAYSQYDSFSLVFGYTLFNNK